MVSNPAFGPVELSSFYDHDPSFDGPGCWQAVPRGQQTLANVPFRIAGLIQLWGEGPAGIGRQYRESVEGIPAKGKFQSLYFLHASSFATAEGTPIAEVVFHYADGASATKVVHFGTEARDWWQPLAERNPLPTNSLSRVVWRGDHPSLPDWVKCLRLFGADMPNPRPESEVTVIDLVSTKSRVAWVVLAITTGPAGRLKPDLQLERDEETPQITVMVSARDKDTSQPIRDMHFRVTLLSGRRPRPYGFFSADENGQAKIELPPEYLKRLSIETSSSSYSSQEMSWNVEQGEKIPTNYVFTVSKEGQ